MIGADIPVIWHIPTFNRFTFGFASIRLISCIQKCVYVGQRRDSHMRRPFPPLWLSVGSWIFEIEPNPHPCTASRTFLNILFVPASAAHSLANILYIHPFLDYFFRPPPNILCLALWGHVRLLPTSRRTGDIVLRPTIYKFVCSMISFARNSIYVLLYKWNFESAFAKVHNIHIVAKVSKCRTARNVFLCAQPKLMYYIEYLYYKWTQWREPFNTL